MIQDGRREAQVEMQVLGYDEMVLPVACGLAMCGCASSTASGGGGSCEEALKRSRWAHRRLLRVVRVRFLMSGMMTRRKMR